MQSLDGVYGQGPEVRLFRAARGRRGLQRIRQAAMRHADPRLTETTYMDEEVLPVFEHVSGLPPLGQSGPSS